MTRTICNECRREVKLDGTLPPAGWISAWIRGGESDLHFCSPLCTAVWFDRQRLQTATALAAAAREADAADVTAAATAEVEPV